MFKRENGGTDKFSNMIKVIQLFRGRARIYIPRRSTIESLNSDGSGFCESQSLYNRRRLFKENNTKIVDTELLGPLPGPWKQVSLDSVFLTSIVCTILTELNFWKNNNIDIICFTNSQTHSLVES